MRLTCPACGRTVPTRARADGRHVSQDAAHDVRTLLTFDGAPPDVVIEWCRVGAAPELADAL